MNKELKYTIPARGSQEFTYNTGIRQIAITNYNGTEGGGTGESTPVSKTIENTAIAHFTDAATTPLLDLAVGIWAQQAGEGVPSPDNVRPISGFSEINVNRTGTNVWDEEWEVGGLTSAGVPASSSNRIRSKNYCPILPNTTYFATCGKTDGGIQNIYYIAVYFYDSDKEFISYVWTNNKTFTTPSNAAYFKITTNSSTVVYGNTYNHDICVNYPSTDTSYHAYSGNTYPFTMPAREGYVYGALYDVLTGKLTIVYKLETYTGAEGETWDYTDGTFRITKPEGSNTRVYVCNWLLWDQPIEANNSIRFDSNDVIIKTDVATSVEDWKTYLAAHNLQVLYGLETPVEYQMQPNEIYALLGENNIFANSGDIVKVSYITSKYGPITDLIEEKTPVFFDALEDLGTYDISLVGATSTDIKNYLLSHKNANIIIRVKRYSTIMLYYLREYSPNYFAEFATHAVIFDAEGTKSMRIDYLRLDLTQETADFTNDYIILPTT